jgi:type IV secretion/conjugal transfer VirB4 family ATPase
MSPPFLEHLRSRLLGSLQEHRDPTNRLPDHLPWYGSVGPGLIYNKNGSFQKTYTFRGPDLASSTNDELIQVSTRLNDVFSRGGAGWSYYVEAQRLQAAPCPESPWPNAASWVVDCERRHNFNEAGNQHETFYFLTFIWTLPSNVNKRAARFFLDDGDGGRPDGDVQRDIEFFRRTVQEITDILAATFPEVSELDDRDTLAYLHSTVSINRQPVLPPLGGVCLDAFLPDMPFTPGFTPMLGDYYIPTAVITDFTPSTCPGFFDQLNRLGIEYRWVTRWIRLVKEEAKKQLERRQQKHLRNRKGLAKLLKEHVTKEESETVDNAAVDSAHDVVGALRVLGADLVSFGEITITFTVWDRDYAAAVEKMRAIKQVANRLGLVIREETLNSQEAWLGSIPGNTAANVRRYLTSSINLAHLLPASAVWPGDEKNRHIATLTGQTESHVYCYTDGTTPFRLNLAVDDVGHTLIIGPTGAGKSTLLVLLALQWLRYERAKVIIFDKDRSSRAATMAVDGHYYEPGNSRAPVAFQPLARVEDLGERAWAAEFIVSLLVLQNYQPTAADKQKIDHALELLADCDVEYRTLSNFVDKLSDLALAPYLRPYTRGGNYGQIFDADHEDFRDASWLMFEMGHLMNMGDAVVIPSLAYLFRRVDAGMDGRPTLLVLDEAWLFLRHDYFQRQLQTWLKTLRKKNVYVVFATQEVADAVNSPIMSTILSACQTQIILPDPQAASALKDAYHNTLKLSETEIEIIANAQRKQEYYFRNSRGNRRLFSAGIGPVALAFCGMSSEDDQKALDEIAASTPSSRYAEEILRYHRLDWAADLVLQASRS